MRYIIILSLVFTGTFSFTQDHFLNIEIKGLAAKEIYLADFYGDKNTFVDTAIVDTAGHASFNFPSPRQTGMYRVFLDKNVFFDIVYNNEDIEIKSDMDNLYEDLVVEKSEENKTYYDFMRRMNDYNRKFDLLAPLNDYYPRSDSFFMEARQEYILVQTDIIAWIDKQVMEHPGKFVNKIMSQRKPIYFDPSLNDLGRREYAKDHFFDHADFTDVDLIRTNVYSSMAIEYMSLFSNPNMKQDQLEDEFIKAVDKIMLESMDHNLIYQFMVEYLVGGFEKYHFDKVLDFVAENYAPEQCENEQASSDLQTRLKKYAELSVGKQAPEIVIPDETGKQVKLSDIGSSYSLIIFWSSTCPHCMQTLPEIEKLYASSLKNSELTIFTVSIDTDRESWLNAIHDLDKGWLNTSSLEGWNTKAAVDYNVYATPTMFLLDQNKKILAKPITFNELKNSLINENLIR